MNMRKLMLHRLFLLLLMVCLLTGCIHNDSPSITKEIAEKATEPTQDYEQYTKDSARAQQAFEELCQDLFEDQLSSSYLVLHYSLTAPEDYGITDCPVNFGDFSLEAMQDSLDELQDTLSQLEAIDKDLLTEEQQLTYDILAYSLEAECDLDGLQLYSQPLTPTTGVQAQLPILLSEYSFYEKEDVENYLTLLSTIDDYYEQILEFEQEKSKAGLFMTDACVDQIVTECDAYLLAPEYNLMSSTFNERIDTMEELAEEEKEDLKSRNLEILSEHFIPAYESLLNGLQELKGTGANDSGICNYPDGKSYYEYLVKSSVCTTYPTIEDLKNAIEAQMNQDLTDMAVIINEHPEIVDETSDYTFSYTEPADILNHLESQIKDDFPECPSCSYVTKYVPEDLQHALSPAFYLVPPLDRFDDNVIYINPGTASGSQTLFTTLAHEGFPGHLYQNVYFFSQCHENIRKALSFSSYSEGWATYVENYAYTMDNGLSPELGQLLAHNSSATLALHALIDINVNYFGWDREQTAEYLGQYYSIDNTDIVDSIYNAMINNPTNYLDYYVGYLEILNMRKEAESTLKDQFDLKSFHQFLLDIGPAPFPVIRTYFEEWLKS